MEKRNYTVVVIDDDPLVNSSVSSVLSDKFERVISFTDADEAVEELESLKPDLILLDIFLGHVNGLDVLEQFYKNGLETPVIMMTAFSDVRMAVRAMKLGAEDFIVKPIDLEQLEMSVERALKNYDMRRQVDLLTEQLKQEIRSDIIGKSEGISQALKIANIVASTPDTTALILGESGTGKELIARHIHKMSKRNKAPFIAINCGAISRELAESEFFGYEKGAFTGATERIKHGRFEQAHHGTIFLDEVGELSLDMQVKLLRVLQEKKFYRLGGAKEVSVDVRLVTATNQNLYKLTEEGKFREDLYYRLNVVTIDLPPLRERTSDILVIASAFVQEFSKKFNKVVKGFTAEAGEILENHYWRGNVRELRNIIERVCLLTTDNVISKEDLNFLRNAPTPVSNPSAPKSLMIQDLKPGTHTLSISSVGASMGSVVRDLLLQTIKLTKGDYDQAARMLGMPTAKLVARVEQLGLDKVTTAG